MMNLFFFIIFSSYIIMLQSVNPLVISILVILQAMIFAISISMLLQFSWFSFLIFIVYLGGILMIFSYIISLSPSISSKEKNSNSMLLFFMLIIFFNSFLMDNSMFMSYFFKKMSHSFLLFSSFSSFYEMTIMMMILLLYLMIIVVFMIESSKGSMRNL